MYDSTDLKPWLRLILSLLLVALLFAGARHFVQRHEQEKREVFYHGILRSYQQVLRPGMNRKEVEDYLRANNETFRQMCCIVFNGPAKHSWDDEVKIAEEDPPWVCRENNVYVGFVFGDSPTVHKENYQADEWDILKAVTLQHQLEGVCSHLQCQTETADRATIEARDRLKPACGRQACPT